MNVLTKPRLNVDEFLDWAVGRPGRYELFRGEVISMSPETAGHAEIKALVYAALRSSIRQRHLPCHVLPDGVVVRIDNETAYEPDAQVYCGEKLKGTALEVPNPIIIVEVLSTSTRRVDLSQKLTGYFKLPSVAHYLIVDPAQPMILHHSRGADAVVMRVFTEGRIALDPPGLDIDLADIYDGA
ncbi:MAG TPA: Uma2 family endonuclease [Xanthobacteraceae bacterium]|nr:Uma2 family endonuclease [Xanthobacteraceae bacterium]